MRPLLVKRMLIVTEVQSVKTLLHANPQTHAHFKLGPYHSFRAFPPYKGPQAAND